MPQWEAPRVVRPHEQPGAERPEVPFREVARKFVSYYKPFTFLFVADLVCATILACIDLAFPQILNFFVRDFFVNARDAIMDVLPWVCVGLVALYLVRSACQYFISCWGHIMGARMEARMRMDLFEQYQRLSFSYYDRNNTGEMMSKLVTDLFDISEVAHHGPENLFIATCKIVGSFVLLMMINVPLTLVMLVVTAIMATYSFVQNYRKRVIFRQNRVKMAGVNTRLQDSLGGIRVVKGFGNEAVEIAKFDRANDEFIETKELSYRFMGQFQMASSLFTGALYTATIVGGGWFVAHGMLDPADMVMYALYIGIFIAPVELLINFTETFQKGYAGFRRFVETLAEQPGVQNRPGARDLDEVLVEKASKRAEVDASAEGDASVEVDASVEPGVRTVAAGRRTEASASTMAVGARAKAADAEGEAVTVDDASASVRGEKPSTSEGSPSSGADAPTSSEVLLDAGAPSIRYRDVHFSYNKGVEVLRGLNLEVPAGSTVALVGPSGGGKTTTCSLLPRFYDVDAGSIEVGGVDVRDVTISSLRAQVGIVQQDVYLFEGTVRDNIAYGDPTASQERIEWAAQQANIHEFVMGLEDGYDTYVGERGTRLSGGQKQRIAIARVFLRNPRILILDEATSALDNESEEKVQASLDRLSTNRTTLVIAHRLSTIRNADIIAVVDEGRVAEVGTHDELLALGGTYSRYYRMQFAGRNE